LYDHDDPYGNYSEGDIDEENSVFFSGVLDGNGYSINNLYMMNIEYVALFYGNDGIIRNLTLLNNIHIGLVQVSNISLINNGSIKNCHCINSQLYGAVFISGFTSTNTMEIYDCSFKGSISGVDETFNVFDIVSGFVFQNVGENSIIENCSCNIDILTAPNGPVAGFCLLSVLSEIKKSYCCCNFYNNIGNSSIFFSDPMMLYSSGFIAICYLSNVEECFSFGNIQGNYKLGGFIGSSIGSTISNSFSNCNIEKMEPVDANAVFGGFICSCSYYELEGEYFYGSIDNCYSTGFVDDINIDGKKSGGFIGSYEFDDHDYDYSRELVQNSYWDIETTDHNISAGLGEEGLTTFEMKYSGVYNGWDFDTIWISHNYNYYPSLRFPRYTLSEKGWFEISNGELQELGYLYDFNESDVLETQALNIDNHKLCYIFNPSEILKPYTFVNEQTGSAYVGQFLLSYDIDIEDNTGEELPLLEVVQGVQHYNSDHDADYGYEGYNSYSDLSIGYSAELVLGNNKIENKLIDLYGIRYQNYPLCILRIIRNHHTNKIKINSISLKQLIWGDDKPYTIDL
jgi:hypothetical protein